MENFSVSANGVRRRFAALVPTPLVAFREILEASLAGVVDVPHQFVLVCGFILIYANGDSRVPSCLICQALVY